MLFLWIFGNNIEDSMGRLVFVVFYLLGGLAALGCQVAIDPDAADPDRRAPAGRSPACSAPTRGCIRARAWSR